MKKTGIALVIIGLILTIITSFKFFTKEKIVDLGPLEITTEKPHDLNWSPILGIVVMGIGGAVLWKSSRKS